MIRLLDSQSRLEVIEQNTNFSTQKTELKPDNPEQQSQQDEALNPLLGSR